MANVSRSLYNDYRSARKSQSADAQARKPIMVQSITKAGIVSKMRDDAKYFETMFDAQQFITNMQRNNPNLVLNYRITDTNNR